MLLGSWQGLIKCFLDKRETSRLRWLDSSDTPPGTRLSTLLFTPVVGVYDQQHMVEEMAHHPQ